MPPGATKCHRGYHRVVTGHQNVDQGTCHHTGCHEVPQGAAGSHRVVPRGTPGCPEVLYGAYPSGTGRHRVQQGAPGCYPRCHRVPQGGTGCPRGSQGDIDGDTGGHRVGHRGQHKPPGATGPSGRHQKQGPTVRHHAA